MQDQIFSCIGPGVLADERELLLFWTAYDAWIFSDTSSCFLPETVLRIERFVFSSLVTENLMCFCSLCLVRRHIMRLSKFTWMNLICYFQVNKHLKQHRACDTLSYPGTAKQDFPWRRVNQKECDPLSPNTGHTCVKETEEWIHFDDLAFFFFLILKIQ